MAGLIEAAYGWPWYRSHRGDPRCLVEVARVGGRFSRRL